MTPGILPTRLIDVGPSDGSENPFLFVPSRTCLVAAERAERWPPRAPGITFRYIALSYCWGGKGNLVTTPENLETRRKGIPWEEVPQTIKDAISITRKLGKYIYIVTKHLTVLHIL